MPVRGRYFGFYVSGEFRGQVQEANSPEYQIPRINHGEPYVAEFYSADAPISIESVYEIERWHHNKIGIGNREYGAWTTSSHPDQGAFTEALLTLIDMDPAQARMCETRPRAF
jgi:hypothetical protein